MKTHKFRVLQKHFFEKIRWNPNTQMKVPAKIWHGTFQIFFPWFGDSGWRNRPKQTRPPQKKVEKLRRTNKRTHKQSITSRNAMQHDTDTTPIWHRHDTAQHTKKHANKQTSKQVNKQANKQTNKSSNQISQLKSSQLKSTQIKANQSKSTNSPQPKKKKKKVSLWQVTKCSIACAHAVAASPTGAMMR